MDRECKQCGTTFVVTNKGPKRLYCGKRCKEKAGYLRRGRGKETCRWCKEEFTKTRITQYLCSSECQANMRKARHGVLPNGNRVCQSCFIEKSPNEYAKDRAVCKECVKEQLAKRYQDKDKKKYANLQKSGSTQVVSGLTYSEKEELLKSQGGRCAICDEEISGRRAHSDHCHVTGRVRDVICARCNIGVGYMESGLLSKFMAYLRKHESPALTEHEKDASIEP